MSNTDTFNNTVLQVAKFGRSTNHRHMTDSNMMLLNPPSPTQAWPFTLWSHNWGDNLLHHKHHFTVSFHYFELLNSCCSLVKCSLLTYHLQGGTFFSLTLSGGSGSSCLQVCSLSKNKRTWKDNNNRMTIFTLTEMLDKDEDKDKE